MFKYVQVLSVSDRVFPDDLWLNAKRAGHKSTAKKQGSLSLSKDRENEVNKILIIPLTLEKRTQVKRAEGVYIWDTR